MMRRLSAMPLARRLFPALIIAALLCLRPSARAEQGEIVKELSVTNTERIFEALKIDYKEVQPGTYRFSLGGYKTLLFNKGSSLQFFASFRKKTTMGRINDWNAGSPYTRAYLDKDGDPVLQADLNLEGGVSYGAVAQFFNTWVDSVKRFTKHIGFDR